MRLTLLLLLSAGAIAQIPDKPTNLQVLPKDMPTGQLMGIMRGFSFALGARCNDCHVGKTSAMADINFASDDLETKKTARKMLQMVAAINKDYVGDGRVECVTCHRGLRKPQTLQAVLSEELEKKDLVSALALYRDLRKKYYGGAQYDFSETAMNQLVEVLGRQHKVKEAAAFMELNAENATLTGWGKNLLAMAHKANGETDKAIADFQKIVDANPNDAWAKQQLEELKGAKK